MNGMSWYGKKILHFVTAEELSVLKLASVDVVGG
jgi:hypothetical protein